MIQSDPKGALDDVSHVFVDEVHERSLDSDYLLILLRRVCGHKKHLKVVLMSATVDPKLFLDYFTNEGEKGGSSEASNGVWQVPPGKKGQQKKEVRKRSVGYTHIEGRTFPVEDIYLDHLIKKIGYVPSSLSDEEAPDVGRIIVALKDGVDYKLISKVVEHVHRELGSSPGSILVFLSGAAEIGRCISAIRDP
jgi:ATP-dependent RNA helicase DHX57